jgi:iduronate 2-sulfatase
MIIGRNRKFTILGFALLSMALAPSCLGELDRGPLNVIYICMEDMMPSFGCYGDSIAITPSIDAFAQESVLFEDVHCQVALCTPSRTSILTGIRPSTSRIVTIEDDWQRMLPGVTSLPRHFRNNGYYTCLAGKIHDYRCGGMDSAYVKSYDIHGLMNNDLALAALENAASQELPFFLAIGYSHTHDPWTPGEAARSKYDPGQFSAAGRSPVYKNERYDDLGIRRLVRNYYGEITEVDSMVGDILQKIQALGLYEHSIILVGCMDHGYNFGYRGRWGKGNCYDNETRVPLLVRVPGNRNNGMRSPALVELVDIYPTLVELCGLPPPPQALEGTSFSPLLTDPEKDWKEAVFTHRAYDVRIVGVKTRDYTLIDFAGDSVQLFDRKKDPLNLEDISGQYPSVVREMMAIRNKGWLHAFDSHSPESQP